MKNKAIFLDRDGTINYDSGYIGNPKLIKLYSGVAEGIKRLKDDYGFLIIVISNQSGITRGYITANDVDSVNNKINDLLAKNKTGIDAFYYCPYHPEFDSPENCKCRKPSPQMVINAAQKFDIDLKKSFFMGDKKSDVLCGLNANMDSILLTTTMLDKEIFMLKNSKKSPTFISSNFLNAVEFIVSNIDGEIVEN